MNSVLETTESSYEIFIVDNNSQDGSYEKLKSYFSHFSNEASNGKINFINNPTNQGFAAANNIAIKKI
ncbi:glycosyltransferase [Methanobrevibacter arboriphilus]|uniref:glycosyltransferase n=1 Tax=Methanobrevibacter arboriphilus TaxID=39441 RepID=UPI001CDB0AAE|nr:glycosyltransferase [Methanobrevibacter arboriphilus]